METSLLSSVTASDHNLYFYFYQNVLFGFTAFRETDPLI